MKLLFLGTGCGTRYPAAWCECEHCRYARSAGGHNVRSHSSALLDNDVLIDLNGETIPNADRMGARLLDVKHLLVYY